MAKILLVDDDDMFRDMLSKTLTKMGHVVVEAHDGKEAHKIFAEAPADLVITDIVMPEKDGIQTIIELRHRYPGLQIVAMSGGGRMSPTNYLKSAKMLGAQRVLAKPFSNQELAAVLNELLPNAAEPDKP